jgi:hypothetical protein
MLLKTLLARPSKSLLEPGWRSGYRASLEIKQKRAKPENGKTAGGLRARRGSNPFPGAINIKLDKPPAFGLFGLSEDFSFVVIADVLKSAF